MGTKYTYNEGATYQSETTPITIAKIPTGDYKIKAVSGDLEGEATFKATPGTQEITLTLSNVSNWDLSKMSISSWTETGDES